MVHEEMNKLLDAEFDNLREMVKKRAQSDARLRVDEKPYQFSLCSQYQSLAVTSVNFNFRGGEHDGENPGIRVFAPGQQQKEESRRYPAVKTVTGINWEDLDADNTISSLQSTDEIVDRLFRMITIK